MGILERKAVTKLTVLAVLLAIGRNTAAVHAADSSYQTRYDVSSKEQENYTVLVEDLWEYEARVTVYGAFLRNFWETAAIICSS